MPTVIILAPYEPDSMVEPMWAFDEIRSLDRPPSVATDWLAAGWVWFVAMVGCGIEGVDE
jgi:hypothetical protein